MQTRFVKVLCDVHCQWDKTLSPRYRVFVNDELFTERTWIWENAYLQEMLQIEAPPGVYNIRFELLDDSNTARINVRNTRVTLGPATINGLKLEIRA